MQGRNCCGKDLLSSSRTTTRGEKENAAMGRHFSLVETNWWSVGGLSYLL
jgi:hypothetical protein